MTAFSIKRSKDTKSLIITVPIDSNLPASTSGKTRFVFNSGGWQGTGVVIEGESVKANVMLTIPPKK